MEIERGYLLPNSEEISNQIIDIFKNTQMKRHFYLAKALINRKNDFFLLIRAPVRSKPPSLCAI